MSQLSEKEFPYDYKSFPLNKINGHATFTGNPTKELMDAVNKMAELAFNNLKTKEMKNALWLVAEGDYAVLKIEVNGKWVELIRERLDSPFSHIIEPAGIQQALDTYKNINP